MKLTTVTAAIVLSAFTLISCEKHEESDHHEGHDHTEESHHDDHDDHSGHDHADHSGHDHSAKVFGPNGGKILTAVSPNAEFLVTDDRKVKITFLSEELQQIASNGQIVSMISGERSVPTTLEFVPEEGSSSLISTSTLPEGKLIPTIVTFKANADAKPVYEKFTLDLSDCPSCEHLEYVCTCDH